jgi:hypothetical protein
MVLFQKKQKKSEREIWVEEFLKYIADNPEVEKEMMQNIRWKASENRKMMNKFYSALLQLSDTTSNQQDLIESGAFQYSLDYVRYLEEKTII